MNNRAMKLLTKHKKMQIDRPITIAICLFIILLLTFFLAMPEYNTFKSLRLELGKKTAEYNAEYEYLSEIANLYNEIQIRKEDLQKIDDALPIGSNFGNLVYYFQNQTSADGLIIKSLFLSKSSSPGSKSDSNEAYQPQIDMSDIVFSLNLMGSYSALENFIVSLEKSARLFEVKTISFGSQPAEQSFGAEAQFQTEQTHNFNLEVATHSY